MRVPTTGLWHRVERHPGRALCLAASLLAAGCAAAGCTAAGFPAPRGLAEANGRPAPGGSGSAAADSPAATLRAMGGAIDRGAAWLITRQNSDGGYGPSIGVKDSSDVGLTAFALYALARWPRGSKEQDGPYISKAVEFITSRQQASGAIYDPKDPTLQNYRTSVGLLALLALDRVKYASVIQKAARFVKSEQLTEAKGYVKEEHLSYGGFGYDGQPGRPDLSNTQFAAEALHQAGLPAADDLWARLQVFVIRCQNAEALDPLVKAAGGGTSKDGGFRYQPMGTGGDSEASGAAKVFSSCGSMTGAGLKSLLYANLSRNDPRVQAAFQWIRKNFNLTENPGLATAADPSKGREGLFYYYHTLAKALAAYREPMVVDDRGVKHRWAKELGDQLISLQNAQGFWVNASERWLESIDVLDTSYAMVALTIAREDLERHLESLPDKGETTGGQ